MQVSWYYNRYKGTYYNSRNAELYQIARFSIKKSIVGAVVCAGVQIFRSYISAFVDAGLCCLPLRLVKNWCRVSDITTNKNCDFASGYEQFAGYNTLFYNPDANPIKPNTNSNHKTYLAYVNYTPSAQFC